VINERLGPGSFLAQLDLGPIRTDEQMRWTNGQLRLRWGAGQAFGTRCRDEAGEEMRRLAIVLAVALAGCASPSGDYGAGNVETAIKAWIDCSAQNANALVKSRMTTYKAAYAAVDACASERERYRRAMYARLGPGYEVEVDMVLQRVRADRARHLVGRIAGERARLQFPNEWSLLVRPDEARS